MTQDVFERLADDHHAHGQASFHLAVAFGRPKLDPTEVRQHLAVLVDGMVDHMSSEEEFLFPWIKHHVPERAFEVDGLVSQHLQIALLIAEFEIGLRRPERYVIDDRLDTAKSFVKLMDNHATLERDLSLLAMRRADPLNRHGR